MRRRGAAAAGHSRNLQQAGAAGRHTGSRHAITHEPRPAGSIDHPFDQVRRRAREIVVEGDHGEAELGIRRQAEVRERRRQDGVGGIQIGVGEELRRNCAILQVDHAHHVLAAGSEAAQLAVEEREVEFSIEVVVDENVELGRIVRVRPLAISADGKLNAELTAANADQPRADRPEIDNREVVAGPRQELLLDPRAGAGQREYVHAAVDCASIVPKDERPFALAVQLQIVR